MQAPFHQTLDDLAAGNLPGSCNVVQNASAAGRHGGGGSARALDSLHARGRREDGAARAQLGLVCAVLAALCLVAVGLAQLHCSGPGPRPCSGQPWSSALRALGLLSGPASPQPAPVFLAPAAQPSPTAAQALCASAVSGIPKIALLFLTRGELWHEGLWREWFRSAAGLVPRAVVAAGNCSADVFHNMASWCAPPADFPGDVIGAQHLFSVFVHTQPGFEGYGAGSPFAGRELPAHINASWGSFDIMDATKALLRAALAEPSNAKMVMLSESCIPLYPPTVAYQQLLSEPRSRVNACPTKGSGSAPWRWHPAMGRDNATVRITPRLWRKSSQWVALERSLAAVVAEDEGIAEVFRSICRETDYDEELGGHYECYSDEHYVPITLAYHGLANRTDCLGYTTAVSWAWAGPHPVSYSPENVTAAALRTMRVPDKCDPAAALKLASFMFVEAGAARSSEACREEPPWSHRLLGRECPLFTRKFPRNTTTAVMDVLTDCESRLGIVPCGRQARAALRPA